MRLRLLALLIFISSFSFGQSLIYTRTVQGNLFLPPGTPATNSRMRFQLKYCQGQNGSVPVNAGNPPGPSGIVVSSQPFDVTVQSDGSWRTQVYGNDQIVCGTDRTGPSRWLIQAVMNGQANAGIEYQIQSCGSASPCQPFSPDSAPRCSLTVVTDCAVEGGAPPDQPDTTVTVNAVMAVPNAINFGNILIPPANGKLINFMLNGNQAAAYLPGNGNSQTCLSGTGSYVLCGGSSGGGGGVSGATAGGGLVLSGTTLGMLRTCAANQYLVWNGSAWVCATPSGGGGGGGFPTTPQYDLFTSTGAGAAQASGILGGSGFLKGQVILATGDVTSAAAPFPLAPNASVEYFPSGATFGGINLGTVNGLAAYFSHSGKSGAAPGYGNGGLMLGGGNNSGTNYQVYLDCESAPALNCDFKVPITVNGAGVGGGGGGGLPTIPAPNLYASNGAAAAVDSGVLGQSGFLRAYVLEATGTGSASPFTVPNGSIEYFPSGATYGGLTVGAANGVAIHFSHSSKTGQGGNGGVALGGANVSGVGTSYQIYLDCEQSPGCDFKVPVTYNGSALGGGGGGGITGATLNGGLVQSGTTLGMITSCTPTQYLSWNGSGWICTTLPASGGVTSINSVAGAFSFTGAGVSCSGTTCTFTGTGGGGSGTVSSGTANQFAWYSATGTTVSSNAHLSDSGTTITSTETLAAPGLNVTGTGGIAMTSAGATLPTPAAASGGIGIGPGGVPQFYSNGGAWTNIGSGGGGGLPTIPVNHVFASNGSGAAVDSNVLAAPNVGGTGLGVVKSGALVVGGMIGGTSPFTGSNGSQEWYGGGGVIGSVTLVNGGVLIMGNSASTVGATGNGGVVLGGNSAAATSSKEVYVDCEHTGCDFKAPITVNGGAVGGGAGSGTVSPNTTPVTNQLAYYPGSWVGSRYTGVGFQILDSNNNIQKVTTAGTTGASAPTWTTTTTTDNTVTWTYVGPGNTTTLYPTGTSVTTGVALASTGAGINIGLGMMQFGANIGVPDSSLSRSAPNLLVTGNGVSNILSTLIKTGNSAVLTADQSFTTTSQPILTLALPASSINWTYHCAVPVSLTGSGAAVFNVGLQTSAALTAASTFSLNYESALGTPTYQHKTTSVSASGITNVMTVNITDIAALTEPVTVEVDGVLRLAGANNVSVTVATSNGTGAAKVGAYCQVN